MEIKTYPIDQLPPLLQRCKDLGYAIFTKYNYDLNLIACRSPSREAGKFDDVFHCIYRLGDRYIEESYICTTDAGLYWLRNPSRVEGTAILQARQTRRKILGAMPKERCCTCVQRQKQESNFGL